MTDPITPPPPHLLKKFSEQARASSQKRGAPNYFKTFATLCIEWAFRELAMNDLRVTSAEVSGVALDSQSTPNDRHIRSSDITPPPELVQEWGHDANLSGVPYNDETGHWAYEQHIATRAAQWGADQELEACEKWVETYDYDEVGRQLAELLRAARRTKPPSLKEQALLAIDTAVADDRLSADVANIVRRALEALDD